MKIIQKKMKHSVLLPFIVMGLLAVIDISCKKTPEGVLNESEMVDLLTDMQLAEAYYNTTPGGVKKIDKNILLESVLHKHGVTHAELDSSIAYYGRNLDDFYILYNKVEKKLQGGNLGSQSQEKVSADDIWPYSRFAAVSKNQTSNGIIFSFPAENILPGTSLEWNMRLTSPEGVEAMLGVEYDNGYSSIYKKRAAGNRSLSVSLQTDTAYKPKRIFGVMTVAPTAMPLWVDSLRLTKTEFDSLTYDRIRMQKLFPKPGTIPSMSSTASERKDSI